MRRTFAALGSALVIFALTFSIAGAQPLLCGPQYPEDLSFWRSYIKAWSDWPEKAQREEALRIGDNPDVLRYLDRLYLVVETGHKLTVLVDCPVQKDALYYLYDHYDETGRFYVIFKAVHEDGRHYVLVSKKDGTSMEVFSRPTWSPDKSRFVAGHCASGPGAMSIVASTPDGLRTEATFTLPCDMGHCEFSWENPSTVQAVCGMGCGNFA